MNKNPGKSVPKWEIWEHYHFPDCYFDWINYNAAAAAKSLHSCPTLCDPIDGSPPGSHVPGILQARTWEWVAISFSNAWKVKSLSHVWLLATSWTAADQAPPSMGFSRQGYWCHCFPNGEMEPKQKQHPDGNGSKVRCYKEQYCIGTWNVRCMNQGKLEVVKQETASGQTSTF